MKYLKFSFRRKNKRTLPKEIWMYIYQYLDNTRPFSATCKQFQRIAQDPTCESSWIITRYGRRLSIYYALLTLPERCHPDFLYTLFRSGAQLPSCLTQALVQNYGKRSTSQFATQIQRLPFTGYVYLIGQSPPTDILGDDSKDFFASLVLNDKRWKDQMDAGFFPLTISRSILKLAQMDPIRFQWIEPLFEFDVGARVGLWQAVLALFLDEAFRKSKITVERKRQLLTAQSVTRRMESEDLFCNVFAEFLTKYPRGYCDAQTMDRMLGLLVVYIQPTGFSIPQALTSIRNLRSDIQERLNVYLESL
ncbi:hypothetical protein G6F56_006857 [Rhizopus delemar]|nr:hypothetical protein G6F56_006857 [Rhizopus delemar]